MQSATALGHEHSALCAEVADQGAVAQSGNALAGNHDHPAVVSVVVLERRVHRDKPARVNVKCSSLSERVVIGECGGNKLQLHVADDSHEWGRFEEVAVPSALGYDDLLEKRRVAAWVVELCDASSVAWKVRWSIARGEAAGDECLNEKKKPPALKFTFTNCR